MWQQMASDAASVFRSHVFFFFCFVFVFSAAKKAKKAHRPLKKQVSSPNFQRKDKPEKVSQRLCSCLLEITQWREKCNTKKVFCFGLMIQHSVIFDALKWGIVDTKWRCQLFLHSTTAVDIVLQFTLHLKTLTLKSESFRFWNRFSFFQSQSRDNTPFTWVHLQTHHHITHAHAHADVFL